MKLEGLGWLGIPTERFVETVALYRDVMGLLPYAEDAESARLTSRGSFLSAVCGQ